MIIGFKTGANNWQERRVIVEEDGATMCEIWFRVDKEKEYKQAFEWLDKNNVKMGLHHWAMCSGGVKNNLATHHREVRDESIAQMKKSIDIGQEVACLYVNIHPGAQYLETVAFEPWHSSLIDKPPTKREEAEKLMLDAALELNEYAISKGVLLTIETLCATECVVARDRSKVYKPGNLGLDVMKDIATGGTAIANDITHTATAGVYDKDEPSKKDMWQVLMDFTEITHEQTRLIHVNTLTRPYNGTDSHDGLTVEDFRSGVWPNREQLKQVLAMFKERKDVYAIPEPKEDMRGNYQALDKLADEL